MKRAIIFLIIGIFVGFLIAGIYYSSAYTSKANYDFSQKRINETQQSVERADKIKDCLGEAGRNMRDGMNWCLAFNTFCIVSSETNLKDCRDCLRRVDNNYVIEVNTKCYNSSDIYGGTLDICNVGWGIKGSILKLNPTEYAQICK